MPGELEATPERLQRLTSAGAISRSDLRRATDRLKPDPADWLRFLHFLLTGSGLALLVIGIIFFFAFNWKDLHRFSKFGIMQGVVVLSLLAHLLLRGSASRMAGLASMVLIGPLFAVFGQVYQTGADAYELFVTWTVLSFPIALCSRFAATWIIWVFLVNLSTILYFAQARADDDFRHLPVLLFSFHALLLALAESLRIRSAQVWIKALWPCEILVLLATGWATVGALYAIFGSSADFSSAPLAVIYVICFLAGMSAYFFLIRRIFPLTILLGSFIIVFTSLVGEQYASDVADAFWLSLLVVAQAAGAAFFLRFAAEERRP